jgi:hypothetical protein
MTGRGAGWEKHLVQMRVASTGKSPLAASDFHFRLPAKGRSDDSITDRQKDIKRTDAAMARRKIQRKIQPAHSCRTNNLQE